MGGFKGIDHDCSVVLVLDDARVNARERLSRCIEEHVIIEVDDVPEGGAMGLTNRIVEFLNANRDARPCKCLIVMHHRTLEDEGFAQWLREEIDPRMHRFSIGRAGNILVTVYGCPKGGGVSIGRINCMRISRSADQNQTVWELDHNLRMFATGIVDWRLIADGAVFGPPIQVEGAEHL